MRPFPRRQRLTIHDVCSILEVSEPTLRRMIRRKAFPSATFRGRRGEWHRSVVIAFARSQLLRWLGERRWCFPYPVMRRGARDTDAHVRRLLDDIDRDDERRFALLPLDHQAMIRELQRDSDRIFAELQAQRQASAS